MRLALAIQISIFIWAIISCQSTNQDGVSASMEVMSTIDTNEVMAVQLPRLDSERLSVEGAEKRKSEIYGMHLSVKHHQWKNPTTGGAIHINQNDEIEIYQFTLNMMYVGKGLDQNGDSVV